jgi:ubiquinone/menaquinone biosynthesis C-methylase UbiE
VYYRFLFAMATEQPQVDPHHYRAGYDSRRRFLSYWNQIDQVRRAEPETLLEVGIGNGFVSRYLRDAGYRIHTVDFDGRLEPDTVASVTKLPFDDGEFDVTCCFETLEHLPWDQFGAALRELRRVARRLVLLSLPDVTPYVRFSVGAGFRSVWVDRAVDYPRLKPKEHRFDGQHHWEIGKRGFRLREVKNAMRLAGVRVVETHRDYDDPYHRFFVCKPD